MAQRVKIVLIDDVDGATAEETVAFQLDGAEYEIDLSRANSAALRSTIEKCRPTRAGSPAEAQEVGCGSRSARRSRPSVFGRR